MEKASKTLKDYVTNQLSPSPEERKMITNRYEELNEKLSGEKFQSGSYARFTSITPVNDLDVIFVIEKFDFKTEQVGNVIDDLKRHLEREYEGIAEIKPQSHSVGVYFGEEDEFSIDVVPAKEVQEYGKNIFLVPEILHRSKGKRPTFYAEHKDGIDWIKSDPKGYIEHAKKLNDKNENFRDLAKLLKQWKRQHKSQNEEFPLKSFHLELVVGKCVESGGEKPFLELLKDCFIFLEKNLEEGANFVDKAYENNPREKKYIDEYVNELASGILKKTKEAIEHAQNCLLELNEDSQEGDVLKTLNRLLLYETSEERTFAVSGNYSLALANDNHAEIPNWLVNNQGKVKIQAYLYSLNKKKKQGGVGSNGRTVPSGFNIKFVAKVRNIRKPYKVFWQVTNTGKHAIEKNCPRGNIMREGTGEVHWEPTEYTGTHWVKCFVIQNEECVAESEKFFVKIKNPEY